MEEKKFIKYVPKKTKTINNDKVSTYLKKLERERNKCDSELNVKNNTINKMLYLVRPIK
jgi:hypothetical protein